MKKHPLLLLTVLLAGLLAVLISAGSCSRLTPARIQPRIDVVQADVNELGSRNALPVTPTGDPDGGAFLIKDGEITFRVAFANHFVGLRISNQTSRPLQLDWNESRIVDRKDLAYPIRLAGKTIMASEDTSPEMIQVDPGGKNEYRLTSFRGGASELGIARPFFQVNRFNPKVAEKQSKELLGKQVLLILSLSAGKRNLKYTFTGRLEALSVGDKTYNRN